MEKRAKITALCNQKGGVGKTVTAVNLGIGLAREGKRVLLVDVDSQGSLTASLGYQHPDQMENTLAAILGRIISDEPVSPGEGIIHHAEGVDLLPANIELSGLEVTLVNTMSRETILREYLNSVRDQYDMILLDCCPSLGIQAYSVAAAFGTGVVFTIPENGILHGSERHSLELHASRRIAEILLHSGEIPENHNIVEIIHREPPVAEKVNHQIVVLLRKLSFLLCHRTQRPHVYHSNQLVK